MIRLRTLGALDLRGSEEQELRTVLAQPKRAALLAYLALAAPRGPHRRDTLLALFWPEQDTEHARNALSQAVHFLRRSLGAEAVVANNGDGLGLECKDFWCDAVAFEEALDRGSPAEALDLYRGNLLEGFHVADAPEFGQWLETERARLGSRYAQALEAVAQEREVAGDHGGAVRLWRQLAARDLYNSRVALRLMRALAAAGDPAGAIHHARLHQTLLREEMGLAPDREIAGLVRQLQEAPSTEQRQLKSDERRVSPEAIAGAEPGDSETAGIESESRSGPQRVSRRRLAITAAGLVALLTAGGAVTLRNGAREPPIPPVRSLAVLPLENLSTDPVQQSFADGMHDALIGELARYPNLTVISRTSMVQYKETKKRLPEIARELKVEGVVEGTVLRDGGRVRVNVQLLHGPSDRHLWAKSYERDLRDVLLLQADLADAIAREVRAVTSPVEPSQRRAEGPRDSLPGELYLRELYLRGRHAENSRSPLGVQTAKQYYQRALERDSNFALGYAGLAAVHGFMADYDFAPMGPALDTARMMARRAVGLDSTLSETRTALALTLGDAGEFEAAEREFRRAIELGPSDARAHYWYSLLLVALGRGEEALREARRSAELDPFGPRGQTGMLRYATWLVSGERPHLRLPVAQRRMILKVEPGEPWARALDAYEYAAEGQCAEASQSISQARQLAPASFRMLAFVATVDWLCGRTAQARGLVEKMKRRPDARDQGFRIALVHAAFGEQDSAFAWLKHQRWTLGQLSGLSADRRVDPLRSDPRFPELLRRLGLR
jgi:TolB-like protein/DNA-binding SARP family transcriptional activator/Flp pilus assembly protein TadD